jgi:hypothetical protein
VFASKRALKEVPSFEKRTEINTGTGGGTFNETTVKLFLKTNTGKYSFADGPDNAAVTCKIPAILLLACVIEKVNPFVCTAFVMSILAGTKVDTAPVPVSLVPKLKVREEDGRASKVT